MQRWSAHFPAPWIAVRVKKTRQNKYPWGARLCGGSCPGKGGGVRSSDVQGYFRAGLFELGLQGGELVGDLLQCAIVEFRENELVQRFLLRGQTRQMLISLVGKRHLHDPGVFGRGSAAYKPLLFQKLRLSCDKRRINMQLLGDDVDGYAVSFIHVRQG